MRLEMASFVVRDVRFADRTRFEAGVLEVNRDELRRLILDGGDFADVAVEVVRPGDQVRLIHVIDAVEPRCKLGEASAFPGFIGPPQVAGEGRAHRLAGMAIVSLGEAVAGEPTYWREAIVDMVGPGATASPHGSTINLVLDLEPHPRYLEPDRPGAVIHNIMVGSEFAQRYNRAVRVAELKVAAYLARTTAGMEPESVQVYELGPVAASLPRVVFFYQVNGQALYGEHFAGDAPRLIHPNEILDGALVSLRSNMHASYRASTFLNQNHALVRELYAHHGVDLSFAGVVIYPNTSDNMHKKEAMAEAAVQLARSLGAQGACSSYNGGGHPCVEFMLICQKCEQAGITTVQLMPESYGTPEDAGFVYFVPEATAIVSTGRSTHGVELPPLPRVIGGQEFFDLPDAPAGSLRVPYRYLYGSCTNTGYGQLAGRQY
ncbi:MAG: hypothetical protein HY690_17390 [Chloroflexi bacterium]|nr:hypothetical protein [Chloroflexota bacterium]